MRKYIYGTLLISSLLFGVALYKWYDIMYIVECHTSFYSEMMNTVDTVEADNHVQDHVRFMMRQRFLVWLWSHKLIDETGKPIDEFKINYYILSHDDEFCFAEVETSDRTYSFRTRYPWKSGPQKIYDKYYNVNDLTKEDMLARLKEREAK